MANPSPLATNWQAEIPVGKSTGAEALRVLTGSPRRTND
jgi:hypothetical protein